MSGVYAALSAPLLVLSLAAGAWGAWHWYRVEPSEPFWKLLRAAQAMLLPPLVGLGVLVLLGHRPHSSLFYVYALVPVAVSFVAEQLRISAAETVLEARDVESAQAVGRLPAAEQRSVVLAIVRREMGVMTAAALVVFVLALRAVTTSAGL